VKNLVEAGVSGSHSDLVVSVCDLCTLRRALSRSKRKGWLCRSGRDWGKRR
jgi:hypothetical protein